MGVRRSHIVPASVRPPSPGVLHIPGFAGGDAEIVSYRWRGDAAVDVVLRDGPASPWLFHLSQLGLRVPVVWLGSGSSRVGFFNVLLSGARSTVDSGVAFLSLSVDALASTAT